MRPRLNGITQVRQGDVLLVKVAKIPKSAKAQPAEDGRVTVAYGEATGHHHSFNNGATLFRPDDMPSGLGGFIKVDEGGAVLEHQEHNPIQLPAALYIQAIQVEEVAGEITVVYD